MNILHLLGVYKYNKEVAAQSPGSACLSNKTLADVLVERVREGGRPGVII